MKTLFILRHAEAAPNDPRGDFERPLTDKGLKAAMALGRMMAQRGYMPDSVLCSPARRTKQTLETVMESVKIGPVKYDKAVYHAGPEELLEIARGFADVNDSVLIVGHNPAIHVLAATLAGSDGAFPDKLAAAYPPGTLSVISCDADRWEDLRTGANMIKDLLRAD